MPDLHSPSDLDRAFGALVSDLDGRAPRPGAAAAVATTRRRRRMTVATLTAAAVLAVGAVALPLGVPERIGLVADLPEPEPLDAPAFEEATEGWISGWTADRPTGSFTQPACDRSSSVRPREVTVGRSTFASSAHAGAVVAIRSYRNAAVAGEVHDSMVSMLVLCRAANGGIVGHYPAGTEVTHYRLADTSPEPGPALTDVWVATIDDRVGLIEATTDGGPADADTVESVADALVAGLRSGWTQERLEAAPPVPEAGPRTLDFDSEGLRVALDGWRTAEPEDAWGATATPCLELPRDGKDVHTVEDRRIATMTLTRMGRAPVADATESVLEGLRGCASVQMTERALPGGISVFTYDRGGDTGHGAVWLGSQDDRVLVVEVDGAATPVPANTRDAAGAWAREALEQD